MQQNRDLELCPSVKRMINFTASRPVIGNTIVLHPRLVLVLRQYNHISINILGCQYTTLCMIDSSHTHTRTHTHTHTHTYTYTYR